MKKLLIMACAVVFLACGCANDAEEQGVVARVNGRPIMLKQLKARYDQQQPGWTGSAPSSVGTLKKDYGKALSDLIVHALVEQELERLGLSVTDEELKAAEDEIRADYPDDTFEQTLVEGYIDIDVWREQLRAQLAQDKFMREVIRPQIKISYKEAEEYLAKQTYTLPERVLFIQLAGPDKGALERAAAIILGAPADQPQADVLAALPEGVRVHEQKVRTDRLPDDWRKILDTLAPRQAGPGTVSAEGAELLILLERIPAKVLDPSQAYPFVEKVLLERKMRDAFNAWYEGAAASSQIQVSTHLIPGKNDEGEGSTGSTEPLPPSLDENRDSSADSEPAVAPDAAVAPDTDMVPVQGVPKDDESDTPEKGVPPAPER
ncbi:MAG: peptidylprolyl isomerase [Desulfovibrionaceae bacterium]